MNQETSNKLYAEANNLFPGGVNSPVRAFRSVEGSPLFIKRGLAVEFGMKTTTSLLTSVVLGVH